MNAPRGKLPAYGKAVLAMRQKGLAPSGWLAVQREWPKPPRPWCVVVPGDEDPSNYDLSLCCGLSVLVATSSGDKNNAALAGLIEAAHPAVAAMMSDGEFRGWIGGVHG